MSQVVQMLFEGRAVRVQLAVIWALMLRETRTRYGKSKIGYVWALLEPVFQIAVFWMIFHLSGRSKAGMAVPVFLLTGFIPWGLFSNIVQRSVNAVDGNRALLTYPQVTPLDIIIARTMLETATTIVVMFILLGSFSFAGYPFEMHDLALVMEAFGALVVLGFGLGLCLSSMALYLPSTDKVVSFILRPMFFTTGIFFVANILPFWVQKLLLLNPMLNVIEYVRAGFFSSYKPQLASLAYPAGLGIIFMFFGLLIERYARRRIILS